MITTILAIIGAVCVVWFLVRGAAKFARTVQGEIKHKEESAKVNADLARMHAGEAPIHHSKEWYEQRLQGRQ